MIYLQNLIFDFLESSNVEHPSDKSSKTGVMYKLMNHEKKPKEISARSSLKRTENLFEKESKWEKI